MGNSPSYSTVPAMPPAAGDARDDDPSLTEAALAYLRDRSRPQPADAGRRPAPENEDLWGYPRPTPRHRR